VGEAILAKDLHGLPGGVAVALRLRFRVQHCHGVLEAAVATSITLRAASSALPGQDFCAARDEATEVLGLVRSLSLMAQR